MSADLSELFERLADGGTLTLREAYRLIEAEEEYLPQLCRAASALRARHKPPLITYSRKVFIPLVNLCRNRCGYCAFARAPSDPDACLLSPEEVIEIARRGEALGCKEALFSLGERPELRYETARRALRRMGYASTLEYLRAMCDLTLRQTRLLPHVNGGALREDEMAALRPVSVSMGMMLETVSARLTQPGQAHWNCPDKTPAQRLATLEAAGRLAAPFTTGILIGIGETRRERVDALFAIRQIHARYGHIQEVIIQNFRAKPGTRMARCAEPDMNEMLRTLAAARLILGGEMNIQAPPNLADGDFARYLQAGIDDWGGVSPLTPDHINPEAAWPQIARLRAETARCGYTLRERLALHPQYARAAQRWLDPALQPRLAAYLDAGGFVRAEEEVLV